MLLKAYTVYKLRLKTAVLIDFTFIKWYNKYNYYAGKMRYIIPVIKILTKRIDFRLVEYFIAFGGNAEGFYFVRRSVT